MSLSHTRVLGPTAVVLAALATACSGGDGAPPGETSAVDQSALHGAAACGDRFVSVRGDDTLGGAANDCRDHVRPCRTIQRGVDAACAGDHVRVRPGDYVENVVVGTRVTIEGDGHATVVRPALSAPNPCLEDSLCGGAASSVFLVAASGVTIRKLTVDGDNPALTSGVVRGGADLDARNGIVTNHLAGRFDDLHVEDVAVRNVYLRGIYASSGGTFRFEDDVVENVQGDAFSVAVFDYGGSGVVTRTRVDGANDAISANHSTGVVFAGNVVTHSGSGLHTDNAGDAGGAPGDRIEDNVVTDCTAGGYGIFVFIPYDQVTVRRNVVRGCDVGLAAFGRGADVTTLFEGNRVEGGCASTSIGAWVTTDQQGFGSGDVSASFVDNEVTRMATGFQIDEQPGFTAQATLTCNRITHDDVGVRTASANVVLHDDAIAHDDVGVDATAVTSGTVDARDDYWGCHAGPPASGCVPVLGPVDTSDADSTPPRCARR